MLRRIGLTAIVVALLWLAAVFLAQPSHQRDWEFGMTVLPQITIQGDSVFARNVRNFRYTPQGPASTDYIDQTFAADQLERVWFVREPFSVGPFTGFKGVAHTYFVFDFQDQPPLTISVEARREQGEAYDVFQGLLNQYELIYIWGTEADQTVRRVVIEHNQLYMYPLTISSQSARALFLQLAHASHQLETQPRFYNSLTSNCTNELAKAANRVRPGAIPPNISFVLPGYSNAVLYDLGFIPTDVPLEELDQRYAISDIVMASYEQEAFSRLLRLELEKRSSSLPSLTGPGAAR
jgi:hypothetical protein